MRQKEESNLNFSRFDFNSLPACQPASLTIPWFNYPLAIWLRSIISTLFLSYLNIVALILLFAFMMLCSVLAFDYRAMWVCRFGWISFTSSIKCCRRYHYRHCVWLLVCDTDSGGLLELLLLLLVLLFLLKYAQSTWKVNATTGRLVDRQTNRLADLLRILAGLL